VKEADKQKEKKRIYELLQRMNDFFFNFTSMTGQKHQVPQISFFLNCSR
jgi:hypothetical protein